MTQAVSAPASLGSSAPLGGGNHLPPGAGIAALNQRLLAEPGASKRPAHAPGIGHHAPSRLRSVAQVEVGGSSPPHSGPATPTTLPAPALPAGQEAASAQASTGSGTAHTTTVHHAAIHHPAHGASAPAGHGSHSHLGASRHPRHSGSPVEELAPALEEALDRLPLDDPMGGVAVTAV
jgi:hypothetical protein